ncbi:MAG: hypothetical protein R3E87_07730 [Burkholderiaceae bacterium]
MKLRHAVITIGFAVLAHGPAHAWQVYVHGGLPTLGLGIAQPINERMVLRADYASTGSLDDRVSEEGIDYRATGRLARFALFADWFPGGGSFRFTGGITFNQSKLDMNAVPTGNTLEIGGQTYPVTANDRFDVTIDYPDVTPYLGIGWGSRRTDPGWHFSADMGVSIGRASLSSRLSGQLAGAPGIDAAVDRELAELRDGVGKVRVLPQFMFGVGYRF